MEAQFSDVEFSDILGAFAEVDDMLIVWDVLMTPTRDDGASTQPVDQQLENTQEGPFPFISGGLADEFLTTTASTSLRNSRVEDFAQTRVDMPRMLSSIPSQADTCTQKLLQESFQIPQPSPGAFEQAEHLLGPQLIWPLQHTLHPKHQKLNESVQQFQTPSPYIIQQTPSVQHGPVHALPQQQQQLDNIHRTPQHLQQQQWPPHHHSLLGHPGTALPYIVQTPSSSLTADPSSGSPARGSMDASTAVGGSHAAGVSGVAAETSNLSGAISEHDGDGACWSSTSSMVTSLQPQQAITASGPAGGVLPAPLIPFPQGSFITTDAAGITVWAPVAHLPPANEPGPAGLTPNPVSTPNMQPGPAHAFAIPTAAPAQLLPLTHGSGLHAIPRSGLQLGRCGSGPFQEGLELGLEMGTAGGTLSGSGALSAWRPASASDPCIGLHEGLPGPGGHSGAAGGNAVVEGVLMLDTASFGVGVGTIRQSTQVLVSEQPKPSPTANAGAGATAAAADATAPLFQLAAALPQSAISLAPAVSAGTSAAATAAPPAVKPPAGSAVGVSGSALLAELIAEATSGGWAAVATGLAPLPPNEGRTAEELLAGLDLQEVFAPSKPSHAKRIRGHVRRAAELKAHLADRVRAIQRLAAANADLRGRAKVLELVVRCRDEQLCLLRNYRTSADGRLYYVEQLGLGSEAEEKAGGAAGSGLMVPYIGTNAAALATMPASGLLEMFRKLFADISLSLAGVEIDVQSVVVAAPPPPIASHRTTGHNAIERMQLALSTEAPAAASTAAADTTNDAGPLARLRSQMALLRNLLRYVGLVNEEAGKFAFTTLNGETVAPEPRHWLRVVQSLGLSSQQLADAAALHACWQDWLSRIHAERRSVAAALDQLLSVNRYGATYFESVGPYGTDRDVIHKMHANVMRERILLVLTGEVFCCHILTDLQWARAVVKSHPYILDVRELIRAASQLYFSSMRGLMPAGQS